MSQFHPAIAQTPRTFTLHEAKSGIVNRGEVIQEGHAKGIFVGLSPRGEAWVSWQSLPVIAAGMSPHAFRQMCSAFDLKFPSSA